MIDHFDHLVLTTRDTAACVHFYETVLGMRREIFGDNRTAFLFGQQKINLHEYGKEFLPKAHLPVPGALDLCFITAWPLAKVIRHLEVYGVRIAEGPVKRTGATGPIMSIYVRDPDLNLIEIATPCSGA